MRLVFQIICCDAYGIYTYTRIFLVERNIMVSSITTRNFRVEVNKKHQPNYKYSS